MSLKARIGSLIWNSYTRNSYFTVRSIFLETQFLDRVVPRKEIDKLLKTLPIEKMKALEVSGNYFGQLNFKSYETVDYPEFDICIHVLPRKFDIIIADQVFEHIARPYRGGRNVYEMLESNGYFLMITPFLQKIHNFPIDCCRWSETGMQYFLAECGFPLDQIIIGSWGNKQVARANISKQRMSGFPLYNPLIHRNLKNDGIFPVQVWGLARKTLTVDQAVA